MKPERFNGIKIDLDSLSGPEQENLRHYTAQRVAGALHEMAVIDRYLNPLPEPGDLSQENHMGD